MNEDELEKIGDYLTHFVKEMKTFGSKYTGLQRKLNDTIKTKNVDFVKIKYGLGKVLSCTLKKELIVSGF